jgi:hypothetical protein
VLPSIDGERGDLLRVRRSSAWVMDSVRACAEPRPIGSILDYGRRVAQGSGFLAQSPEGEGYLDESVVWADALLGLECRKLLGIGRKARLLSPEEHEYAPLWRHAGRRAP